jgi:hypothetical protein
MLFRGELPAWLLLPQVGPSLSFPIAGLWRDDVSVAAGVGGTVRHAKVADGVGGRTTRSASRAAVRQLGVDAKWEHCIVVADANGSIVETWISGTSCASSALGLHQPMIPRSTWVVDDNMQVIYRFTHDGKQLVQASTRRAGVRTRRTSTARRSSTGCPTGRSSFDGHTARVSRFDKNGVRHAVHQGQPAEREAAFMNNARGRCRSGEPACRQRSQQPPRRCSTRTEVPVRLAHRRRSSSLHLLYIGQDRNIWTFDRSTHKLLSLEPASLIRVGHAGMFPGALWEFHRMSVDMEGNLYVSDVDRGRVQLFRPKAGAHPAFLVSKPVARVWN